MQWLAENWLWVLIGIAFIAMHLFGHGGHGAHGGHGSHGDGKAGRDIGDAVDEDRHRRHTH